MSQSYLNDDEKRALLRLAREVVRRRLEGELQPEPEISSDKFSADGAAFVTIKLGGDLRGCIGYTKAFEPLSDNVIHCAESAAFSDPRFSPLSQSEYDDITFEISVLTPMKLLESPADVKVGRDGLMIQALGRQGLLLPQVATENNWDREIFLSHTCMKAGLPPDQWRSPDCKIFAFQAEIFSEADFKMDS